MDKQTVKVITYRGRDAPDVTPKLQALEASLRALVSSTAEEMAGKVSEAVSALESWKSSQELANGVMDSNISEIENKVSEIIKELSGKTDKVELATLQGDLVTLITNINRELAKKANKNDIPKPTGIVADSSNVTITKKDENTYGIAVDVQEKVVETVIREVGKVGGGVSKATVQKMIDAAVENISGGGGGGTVTDITSVDGSVIVTPIVGGYDLSVDDVYVNVSGDVMTGTLTMSGAGIQLDANIANPPYQEGRVFYDAAEKALSYYTDINGVTVNVGQEHLIKVKNVDGGPLVDGDVVYVFSANGENVTVKKARADLAATSRATIGVVTQACADNASTYITRLGKVHGLNTNAYNEGDTVYLSHTVAGGWTTTLPPAPNRTVRIGYISKKSAGDGHILVDVHDGLSLTEVNDVWITSPTNGQVITYNSVNSRWENTSVVAATSGALDSRYTLLSTTASISGDLQSQINAINYVFSTVATSASIATLDTETTHNSCEYLVSIVNGLNTRTAKVIATTDLSANVAYNIYDTTDIGSVNVTLTMDYSGGMRLRATINDANSYTVKVRKTAI